MEQQFAVATAPAARSTLRYVVIIEGLSGLERYIDQDTEVTDRKKAQRFRSRAGAASAAQSQIAKYDACVARHMAFRIEEA